MPAEAIRSASTIPFALSAISNELTGGTVTLVLGIPIFLGSHIFRSRISLGGLPIASLFGGGFGVLVSEPFLAVKFFSAPIILDALFVASHPLPILLLSLIIALCRSLLGCKKQSRC